MAVTLSLSGDDPGNCDTVVRLMKQLGIPGDVTRNVTILHGGLESGCRVRLFGDMTSLRTLWDATSAECSLACAHVDWTEHRSGCVLDMLRPSKCPGPAKQ